MFFQGSLQEGISTALQQAKQVVCFVTDEGDESQQWENEFLADTLVKASIESQAIALRLKAGSEEAGFLEALFPVPRKPTLIVIQNGQLKEYIAAGASKEDFVRRIGLALSVTLQSAPVTQAPQSTMQDRPTPARAPTVEYDEDDLYGEAPPSSNNHPASTSRPAGGANPEVSTSPSENPNVQALLAERSQRLEADKKAKEAKAKAEKDARSKERRDAAATARNGGPSTAETSYAQMIKKRKYDEKEERQRILRRIEDDKRARRDRDAQEKQARLLLNATSETNTSSSPTLTDTPIPLQSRSSGGANCNLQVRLFDGSMLRAKFPTDVSLQKDVRMWIDENRADGDAPYTFRVVLAPLPNKAIEPADEAQTLLELGLAPSATLILVPVVRFATAYAQASGNALWRGWVYIYAIVAMLFGLPRMLLRGRGGGNRGVQFEEVPLEDMDGTGSARHRIRGFQNPDDRGRDQQLYNGNSLNFEPRRDEDETNE